MYILKGSTRASTNDCAVFWHSLGTTVSNYSLFKQPVNSHLYFQNIRNYRIARPMRDTVTDAFFVGKKAVCYKHSPIGLWSLRSYCHVWRQNAYVKDKFQTWPQLVCLRNFGPFLLQPRLYVEWFSAFLLSQTSFWRYFNI